MTNLLCVHEERIPLMLRDLVQEFAARYGFDSQKMYYSDSTDDKRKKLSWADLILFAPGRHLSDQLLESAINVKLMQLWSSGFDKFNVEGAKQCGITVANNGGGNAGAVAEHAILLMLSIYKWLPNSYLRTVEGRWEGNSHGLDMFSLAGKTLGIVGMGSIGSQVAAKVAGFSMEVNYFDIERKYDLESKLNVKYKSFSEILEGSDIITIHVHANSETSNMIGKKEFDLMKPTTVLINVSRAELVDQEALLKALEESQIWGVGLDTYLIEPTIAGDPLLNHPRVVCTPHMAATTYDSYLVVLERCFENLRRAEMGQMPLYQI